MAAINTAEAHISLMILISSSCSSEIMSIIFSIAVLIISPILTKPTSTEFYHCSFLEKYIIIASAMNKPMLPISKA